jgi:hypothetical protein
MKTEKMSRNIDIPESVLFNAKIMKFQMVFCDLGEE